jgi:N utilization substance protein B
MSNVPTSRRDIRALIFHLLYAMESFDYQVSLEELIGIFNREFETSIAPDGEVVKIVQGVVNDRVQLDEGIKPLLANWRLDRLGWSTRLILRLAFWEMLHTKTASTIIINEAIELAKSFSERDAYKFVNGILDEAAKKRPVSSSDVLEGKW